MRAILKTTCFPVDEHQLFWPILVSYWLWGRFPDNEALSQTQLLCAAIHFFHRLELNDHWNALKRARTWKKIWSNESNPFRDGPLKDMGFHGQGTLKKKSVSKAWTTSKAPVIFSRSHSIGCGRLAKNGGADGAAKVMWQRTTNFRASGFKAL